ncbi:MAG TPA: AraC family transcriptional regulator, partial [Mycobacterium sp.]|nr:AraC family transcriptional regulator [Mycobacterium sp.]
MGSLIRAAAIWGYPELVRELGGDPEAFLSRFHIPSGAEHQEDAFLSFEAFIRLLEASAE